MNSTNVSGPKNIQTESGHKGADIVAFHRFMIWAYEEADTTFEDEFLKAALETIIYYLAKHHNVSSETAH